jgi:nucleoside diphosphate kinase
MKTLKKYYEDLVLNPSPNAFCMLKPGFTQYKDEFEKQLAAKGWKIINCCAKKFTRQEIEEFYSCHKDKDFFIKLCDYMITGHCECYSCYKRCDDPIKEMNKFKDKIRDEWGEDEMRNAMHSSDSKENVIRECSLAFNTVNERLHISNDHHIDTSVTAEEFYDALKLYTGKYRLPKTKGTFMLDDYCEDNNIEKFIGIDKYEDNFDANLLRVRYKKGNTYLEISGDDWRGKTLIQEITDFDEFVKGFLSRWYGKKSDPEGGKKHLQNIYNILIDNK